ncbi:MAG: type III-B CRISPR module-associated Cmr3 family protein [Candidatus Competibacter sp.]|nr:type III-B CRISPR module-associated Cmr3 family protein [Candidatus Competibacter sp.]MDG4584923.1 type III-B CRISPR module-associated Cmr3 family protein [Candidatus Competibacter sp.]
MTEYRFIEPLDVLYLRGNKLFGDAGSYGEALMPPWPSLAAGALRSRMLADHGVDLAAFSQARERLPDLSDALHACLGTPQKPGDFRVSLFTLACREKGQVQPCFPLPADVVVTAKTLDDATYLQPTTPHPALSNSYTLSQPPLLCAADPAKPQSNLWLNAAGMGAWLNGEKLGKDHLRRGGELWQFDHRLGIALNGAQRTVAKGMLYTAQTVALNRRDGRGQGRDVGFLVGVDGASDLLPKDGLLRFGGDGRGAALQVVSGKDVLPAPDWRRIEQERRFRLVLATPGLFADGWRLPGLDADSRWQGPDGCTARLVAAAVNRADTVSGWDLARWRPKSAQRVAPVGSVYWFDDFQGKADALGKLAAEGFWAMSDYPDPSRRAEGFNNLLIAAWPK